MSFFDPVTERLRFMKRLSPSELKKLANRRLSDVITSEIPRAHRRIDDLERRYPSAEVRELGHRLIDAKKALASMTGGISGVFGLASVPADLMVMAWLQLVLLTEVALLHKVNLKSKRAQGELLDLFGYANGIGPLKRTGPQLFGRVAERLLRETSLETVGRALPLVAAPVTAYLNNRHIQAVGDEALRFYGEGFQKARAKSRRKTGT